LNKKAEVLEENIDTVVNENVEQFDQYQGILENNNKVTNTMIEDLRRVQKQHFEMENINECLEQRIDQLKGQRDLSILLSQSG